MSKGTQGLDALAALCGSAAASPVSGAAAPTAAAATAPAPSPQLSSANNNNLAAASLYAQQMQQQQQQQQQQAQALQIQQVLAMRHAAAVAQQQQQQQVNTTPCATSANTANSLPPHIVQQAQQQLQLLAAQQQQQQQAANRQQAQQQVQQELAQQQAQQQQAAQAQALAAQLFAAQQQAQAQATQPSGGLASALNPAALASLAAGQVSLPGAAGSLSQLTSSSPALANTTNVHAAQQQQHLASPNSLAMPPPPSKVLPALPISTQQPSPVGMSKSSLQAATAVVAAAVQPPIQEIISEWEDKKKAKRAANRLSAHQSRKRKKMYIEDLKDENVELRRKELILRSIPDLIVVFDSSGAISFVSHSVDKFLEGCTPEELEGTSFWDLMTEESVRSIKSAFMDALAVKRHPDEDSTPLADGGSTVVELIHGNKVGGGGGLLVSLKGVVHFTGESPECVCSIRPSEVGDSSHQTESRKKSKTASAKNLSAKLKERAASSMSASSSIHQISDSDSQRS